MCDEVHFIKGKTGSKAEHFFFDAGNMVIDEAEIHLICPCCGQDDELHLIETVVVERKLGEVTTNHTEYLDLIKDSEDEFTEIGITCHRCDFTYKGSDWKSSLKGVVVNAFA
jgi:protein-arginine kinase activator protein McsA